MYEVFLVRRTLKERERHARVRKFTNTASWVLRKLADTTQTQNTHAENTKKVKRRRE